MSVVDGGSGRDKAAGLPDPQDVYAELERILASPEFSRSRRMKGFLRYVVEAALKGEGDRLKEYSIAIEVFDRDADFDPQTNSLVRVEAGRLRRTMTQYYLTHGREDPLRIEIPRGTYAPEFSRPDSDGARPGRSATAEGSNGETEGPPAVTARAGNGSNPPVAEAARGSRPRDAAARPPTVLVVDDEPQIEALISQKYRRRVRDGSLALVYAHDGEEALDRLLTTPNIDMVLTDINMPRMDGLTLLDHLPEINPITPAVVVSAYGDMANIRTAMNRGAFDFVTKPINFDDLTATIDKALAHLAILREAASEHDQLLSLRKEFAIAERLQRVSVPESFPEDPRFAVQGHSEPSAEIGGDFFDVFEVGEGRYGLLIGEVSGHGIRGALGMAVVRTGIKTAAMAGLSPADCLQRFNSLLSSQPSSGIAASIYLCLYDATSGSISAANADHQPPYILRASGALETCEGEAGVAVGLQAETRYTEHELRLDPGDCLFLYSDGLPGAFDANRRQFSADRLEEALVAANDAAPQDLIVKVLQALESFVGSAQKVTGVTCLAFQRRAP